MGPALLGDGMIEQIEGMYRKVFGTRSDRILKKLQPMVDQVNGL